MMDDKKEFYKSVESGVATHKLEKKLASIDDTFNVLAASKSFYSYFEGGGARIFTMIEFVHPDEVEEFKTFVCSKENIGKRKLFRLLAGTGDYHIDIVKVRSIKHMTNEKMYMDIEIIDVEEAVYINELVMSDITKLRVLLGMTNEYFFSYDKKDNMFKMFRYNELKREMLYKMDLDEWKADMISKKYIREEELGMFDSFINDMKSYARMFTVKLNCAIRTQSEQMESLKFSGMLYSASESDKTIIGRVMVNAGGSLAATSVEIMDELQYDALTGVYNKKTITEYANKLINERKNGNVTLVIMDVDHFKNVNDTYGHLYGDKVLARVGQKLKEVVGEEGIVGRIGGDEFMIVLTDITDDQMLRSMLRAIRSQIKWEFSEDFTDFTITCSLGASICPNNGKDYEDLFKKADYCLYIAKEKGRDRYVYFRDDLHRQSYEDSLSKTDTNSQNTTREVKELMYIRQFFADVHINRAKAIKGLLEHMRTAYNIDSINIYYGDGMDRVYTVGTVLNDSDEARYVHTDEYKTMLDGNSYVQVGFIGKLINQVPNFCEEMKRRRIFSTLQCIIGTTDNIKGVITFNRCKESAQWADYEVDSAVIFASYITMLAGNE